MMMLGLMLKLYTLFLTNISASITKASFTTTKLLMQMTITLITSLLWPPLTEVGIKKWSQYVINFSVVVEGDRRVPVSWVGDPLPVPLFVLSSFSPVFSSSPMGASIAGVGGFLPSVPRSFFSSIFSLPCSFLLLFFLGVGACRPLRGRITFSYNK